MLGSALSLGGPRLLPHRLATGPVSGAAGFFRPRPHLETSVKAGLTGRGGAVTPNRERPTPYLGEETPPPQNTWARRSCTSKVKRSWSPALSRLGGRYRDGSCREHPHHCHRFRGRGPWCCWLPGSRQRGCLHTCNCLPLFSNRLARIYGRSLNFLVCKSRINSGLQFHTPFPASEMALFFDKKCRAAFHSIESSLGFG